MRAISELLGKGSRGRSKISPKAPRVLFICHNHPAFHPGGTEIFAHDLYRELVETRQIEGMFLACTNGVHRAQKPGTNFQVVGQEPDEIVLWTGHFDRFFMSQVDTHGIVPELSDLLRTFKPDIVHFHHVLMIGVEALFLVRRILPEARIVVTLHDYYSICPNDGQMVKAGSHELCHESGTDACRKCFPDKTPDQFTLRRNHIQTMFGVVDQFVSPSRFLRNRYAAWGLPAACVEVVPNGRPGVTPAPARHVARGGARNVFGYFGNLSPYKGVMVALAAVENLIKAGERDFSFVIHGGAPFQTDEFRNALDAAVKAVGANVSLRGPYVPGDVPKLIEEIDWVIVPSIWWENAPLVIQEAFQHRRPVICSDIGGMAEMVRDGVDGLHFRVGDAHSLADVMKRSLQTPSLWNSLVEKIAAVPTIEQSAARHARLYADLLKHELRVA